MSERKSKNDDLVPAQRRSKMTAAKVVKMLRDLHEMTQADLAAATGIPQPVISAIENGAASVGIDRSKRLARVLKVHPAVIAFADWDGASVRRRSKDVA